MIEEVYKFRDVGKVPWLPGNPLFDVCLLLGEETGRFPSASFLINIVGKDQTMALGDLFDFVRDIGIPNKSRKVKRRARSCCIDVVLAGVREMDLASLMFRGETDDKTPYHTRGLLRVFMTLEARPLLI